MARKNIFKTFSEIQTHFPFQDTLQFDDLLPTLKLVERTYILPDVDATTWSQLLTKIESATYDPEQWEELADRMNYAVAQLVALGQMDKTNVVFSSGGLLVAKTEGMVPASEARTNALRYQLTKDSQTALDHVFEHLENNLAVFTDWATSAEHGDFTNLIIRTAGEFDKAHSINHNRWIFRRMMPTQKMVVDTQIKGNLGAPFMKAYLAELATGSLSTDYLEIKDMLHRAIAHLTMAEALPMLQMQFGPEGIAIFDSQYQPSTARRLDGDENRLNLLRDTALDQGRQELRKLQSYLDDNASATKYPEYFASENYSSPDIDRTELNEENQTDFFAL